MSGGSSRKGQWGAKEERTVNMPPVPNLGICWNDAKATCVTLVTSASSTRETTAGAVSLVLTCASTRSRIVRCIYGLISATSAVSPYFASTYPAVPARLSILLLLLLGLNIRPFFVPEIVQCLPTLSVCCAGTLLGT